MSGLFSAFLAPAFFGLLGLIPLVVLLYLLKLRRTEVVIPSTMLWMKSLHDLTANAPFQRLRRNLLLFLQILAILLIVFALARPFFTAEDAPGSTHCLIIDRSASMQTLEDVNGSQRSRLDIAKATAIEFLDDLGGSDQVMVVSFAENAEVLCELTEDRRRARRAIEAITPTDTRSRIRDVTSIVNSLAPDNPDVTSVIPGLELVLLSDGRLTDPERLGDLSAGIRFVQVGETRENAGIVAFNVRDAEGGVSRQVFVLIHNESDGNYEGTLSLFHQDGPDTEADLMAVEEITVRPEDEQEVVFEIPMLETGILRVALDEADPLLADNQAWLALHPAVAVRALLVSDPDAVSTGFLQRAIGLDPRVDLEVTASNAYTGLDGRQLTVFNGWVPDELPGGTVLCINAVPPVPGLAEEGKLEQPSILATQKDHPLTRYLSMGNVRIAEALRLGLPDGARNLLSTEGDLPLIADVSRGGQQIVVVAFDLAASNWPLQLSFPLFVQNLLYWTPSGGLGEEGLYTGSPVELSPIPGVVEATIRLPDGRAERVRVDEVRPTTFGGTEQAGPYVVTRGDREDVYALNLLDRKESSITPIDVLQVGKGTIEAERGTLRYHYELWPWLILAGLLVLCIEWWVYSRRAYG